MRGNRVLDYLAYVVVRILICIVQATRIETGEAVARWLAWLFHDVIRLRGRVIDENLAHALPDLSAAARDELALRMWEHLFLLVLEVAHAPRKVHETNWRRHLRLRNVAALGAGDDQRAAGDHRDGPLRQFRAGGLRAGDSRFSHLLGGPAVGQSLS